MSNSVLICNKYGKMGKLLRNMCVNIFKSTQYTTHKTGILNSSKIKSSSLPGVRDTFFLKNKYKYLYMKNIITSNAINEAVATISLTVSLLKG